MVALSVLTVMSDPGALLADLVRSVDGQTLPVAEFELIVVEASSDGSAERLEQLARHRPNVTVLHADAEASGPDRLGMALTRATGEFVLVVEQGQRLAPRALELLLDRANRAAADVVLGRVLGRDSSGSAVLPEDSDRLGASWTDPSGCIVMVRRALLGSAPAEGAALLDPHTVLSTAEVVSAVGRYACAIAADGPASAADDVILAPPTVCWRDGVLHLGVAVRLLDPTPPPARAWWVVTSGPAEVATPASIEWDGATGTVSAILDPAIAEGGHPLAEGPWDLRLRLVWTGRDVTLPLAAGPTRAAVVRGRPSVVGGVDGLAQLDVGATRAGVVGPVSTSDARVAESERGALVTIAYDGLHVLGDAVLDGRLMLGTLDLPARLICADGRARLEAYVAALPGVGEVAVVVGGGRPVPTGLLLRVGGSGAMALEELPVAESAAPSIPGADRAPMVQRLRRRLPGVVEPLVRLLARVPVLVRLYRRSINR